MGHIKILTLFCLLGFQYINFCEAVPWVAEARTDQWWVDRHNLYKNATATFKKDINVIFYGDSATEGWYGAGNPVFQRNYAPYSTVNYGISGDRTEHLLYRINDGEVDGLSPRLVYVMIGANNFIHTPDDAVRGIKAVVDLLRQKLPDTNIMLLGLLPAFNDPNWFARHADINIKISKFADGERISFLNMFDQFATGWGKLDMSLYSADQAHLVTAGYQRWADTMRPLFTKLV